MRALLITLLTLGLLGIAPAAEAAATGKRDADDTQGRLDLRRVTLKTQTKAERPLVVGSIATHDDFRNRHLDGANSLRVVFKVRAQRYRGVLVQYLSDELVATVCTYETPTSNRGSDCSTHRVRRTTEHSVRFVVPRAVISKKKVLRWRGQSVSWTRTAGCRTAPTCTDVLGAGGSGFYSWKA